ncbi:MAG TPA: EF-hand domain-containing protein [Methylophilaceae bacterium]
MLISLGFSQIAWAASKEVQNKEAQNDDISSEDSGKPASTYAGAQESVRIRKDLDEYSRTVDPAHVQIEERRRVMRLRLQQRFAETDRNNDGSISRLEAVELMPQVARHFNEVDTNGDNFISFEELAALQAKIMERQQKSATATRVENIPDQSEVIKHKSKDAMLVNHKPTL